MKSAFLDIRPDRNNCYDVAQRLRWLRTIGFGEVVLTGFSGGKTNSDYIAAMRVAITICRELGLHYKMEWCKLTKDPMCYDSESWLMGAVTIRKCKGHKPTVYMRTVREIFYTCAPNARYEASLRSDVDVTVRWWRAGWPSSKFVQCDLKAGVTQRVVLPTPGHDTWVLLTVQDIPIANVHVLDFIETPPPKNEIRAYTPGVRSLVERLYDTVYGEVQWLGTDTEYMAQRTQPRWTSPLVLQRFAEHADWLIETFDLNNDPLFTGFFGWGDEGHTFYQSREEWRRWKNLCEERAWILSWASRTAYAKTGKPLTVFGDGVRGHNDTGDETGNYANNVSGTNGMTTLTYLPEDVRPCIEVWTWAPDQIARIESLSNYLFLMETAGFHALRQVATFNQDEPGHLCKARNDLWPNAEVAYIEPRADLAAVEQWAKEHAIT